MQISQTGANGYSPASPGEAAAAPRPVASDAARTPAATIEMPSKAVEPAQDVPNLDSLKQATDQLNQALKLMSNNLQFMIDEDTNIRVVKVVDTETEEVIRQFPSEDILAIAKALDQWQGLLRDQA